jgi:hypothetical protein
MSTARITLDVRSMLERPMSELRGFADASGHALTPRQVRDALQDLLAGGSELFAIGNNTHFHSTKRT